MGFSNRSSSNTYNLVTMKESIICKECKFKYLGKPNKLGLCPSCKIDYHNRVRKPKKKR